MSKDDTHMNRDSMPRGMQTKSSETALDKLKQTLQPQDSIDKDPNADGFLFSELNTQ